MNIRCLFGHNWGEPYNIRMPFWEYVMCVLTRNKDVEVPEQPKICDRLCSRCGKEWKGGPYGQAVSVKRVE